MCKHAESRAMRYRHAFYAYLAFMEGIPHLEAVYRWRYRRAAYFA